MTDGKRRTLREWREARKLTHEGAMRAGSGVNPSDFKEWERTGYPTRQGGPGRAIRLADTYDAPLELIDFGPNVRGFTEAGCQFVLATNGRDDRGWEAFIAEWRSPEGGMKQASEGVAERAGPGMRTHGPTAKAPLDTLEEQIQQLIQPSPAGAGGGLLPGGA